MKGDPQTCFPLERIWTNVVAPSLNCAKGSPTTILVLSPLSHWQWLTKVLTDRKNTALVEKQLFAKRWTIKLILHSSLAKSVVVPVRKEVLSPLTRLRENMCFGIHPGKKYIAFRSSNFPARRKSAEYRIFKKFPLWDPVFWVSVAIIRTVLKVTSDITAES